MSSSKQDITTRYEEERMRAQDQSQLIYLQGQIDELRRQLKESGNKYTWAIEQVRKSEAIITQLQSMIERQGQEQAQTLETYRRDITALRKEVSNSTIKIDDHTKPIRDIQVSLANLAEQRKQDLQTAQSWFARIELVEQRFTELDSRVRDQIDQHRALQRQIDDLREHDGQLMADLRKMSEEVQIEKQNLRRQSVEGQQIITDSLGQLRELTSRSILLDETIKGIEAQIDPLPEQLELIRSSLPDIVIEVKRIERLSTERFLMNQERLEELRRQQNTQIDELQNTDETQLRQITSWIERLDAWCLEHEGKLARTQSRLEDIQISHLSRMQESERREIQSLSDMLAALQQRLSVAQSEILAQGNE